MRWLNEHMHRLTVDLQSAMPIAQEGIHGRFPSPIASPSALDDGNEGATQASR
jgi:hypothetical protein